MVRIIRKRQLSDSSVSNAPGGDQGATNSRQGPSRTICWTTYGLRRDITLLTWQLQEFWKFQDHQKTLLNNSFNNLENAPTDKKLACLVQFVKELVENTINDNKASSGFLESWDLMNRVSAVKEKTKSEKLVCANKYAELTFLSSCEGKTRHAIALLQYLLNERYAQKMDVFYVCQIFHYICLDNFDAVKPICVFAQVDDGIKRQFMELAHKYSLYMEKKSLKVSDVKQMLAECNDVLNQHADTMEDELVKIIVLWMKSSIHRKKIEGSADIEIPIRSVKLQTIIDRINEVRHKNGSNNYQEYWKNGDSKERPKRMVMTGVLAALEFDVRHDLIKIKSQSQPVEAEGQMIEYLKGCIEYSALERALIGTSTLFSFMNDANVDVRALLKQLVSYLRGQKNPVEHSKPEKCLCDFCILCYRNSSLLAAILHLFTLESNFEASDMKELGAIISKMLDNSEELNCFGDMVPSPSVCELFISSMTNWAKRITAKREAFDRRFVGYTYRVEEMFEKYPIKLLSAAFSFRKQTRLRFTKETAEEMRLFEHLGMRLV